MHEILRRAALGWHEPTYAALATQIGGGSPTLILTRS